MQIVPKSLPLEFARYLPALFLTIFYLHTTDSQQWAENLLTILINGKNGDTRFLGINQLVLPGISELPFLANSNSWCTVSKERTTLKAWQAGLISSLFLNNFINIAFVFAPIYAQFMELLLWNISGHQPWQADVHSVKCCMRKGYL